MAKGVGARFLVTLAAFVLGAVVAFSMLPFGLETFWALPMALLVAALTSGLGAWLAGGRHG
ncbi:MAG: hypothetical protein M3Q49_00650 [Actinomycetota bacterium]|jgi:ABC-type uncharacterized transport system permease subunit|nr:hypothetical protein [Actinomycetota bacterium]MDP9484301.1 hypothetical protein [Actinomycetota bacterium]PLS86110.1 MAG: hypothetical protein CYG60_09010 [Actinomycetota bacterium]